MPAEWDPDSNFSLLGIRRFLTFIVVPIGNPTLPSSGTLTLHLQTL